MVVLMECKTEAHLVGLSDAKIAEMMVVSKVELLVAV